jgi:hypothetical protein
MGCDWISELLVCTLLTKEAIVKFNNSFKIQKGMAESVKKFALVERAVPLR